MYTTSSLSIHPPIDGHLGSFHTLAIVDSAAINMGCMCPLETAHLYPLDKYIVVQLLGRRVVLFLVFEEPPYCFPEWLHQLALPPTVQKRSSFSASSSTSVVASVVNVSHSDKYELISHCGFDLYFPDDE